MGQAPPPHRRHRPRGRRGVPGGADAITSSNTFPSIPLFDPESLEFEIHVDGLVSSGGLGGPAILPLSLAKVSEMTRAYPEKSFSGIGGIAEFRPRPQLPPTGLRHRPGLHRGHARPRGGTGRDPSPADGHAEFLEKNAHRGWTRLEDFKGLRRDRVVPHSQIGGPRTPTTRAATNRRKATRSR